MANAVDYRTQEPRAILLLEDHEDSRMMLVRGISSAGHVCLPYSNNRRAMRDIAGGLIYTLALLDYHDGGYNTGADVVAVSQRYNPTVKLISISAWGREDIPLCLGFNDFLRKPFSLDDLNGMLKKHLG